MIDTLVYSASSHLVESTFFAGAAALLTLAFRANRAEVRFWLWLSASLKFLIPFALLSIAGSHIRAWAPASSLAGLGAPVPTFSDAVESFRHSSQDTAWGVASAGVSFGSTYSSPSSGMTTLDNTKSSAVTSGTKVGSQSGAAPSCRFRRIGRCSASEWPRAALR